MNRRVVTAALVLGLWLTGLAALAHRTLSHDAADQLARVGRLVEPGTEFYTITGHGAQIGFASSTFDTTATGIELTELRVTNLTPADASRRRETRTTVRLTRAFQVTGFTVRYGTDRAPFSISGTVEGDSVVVLSAMAGGGKPRVERVPLTAPLMLPAEVPLAIALGHTLKVGQQYHFTVFAPLRRAFGEARIRVAAESLFVVSDSATFDERANRWVSAHDTTVRAWRFEEPGGGAIEGWFDSGGRVVETHRSHTLMLHRTAYELAFENWSAASKRTRRTAGTATATDSPATSPTVSPRANRR
jgi:hypothetical protein